jgi:hypothetical protein
MARYSKSAPQTLAHPRRHKNSEQKPKIESTNAGTNLEISTKSTPAPATIPSSKPAPTPTYTSPKKVKFPNEPSNPLNPKVQP